MASASGTTILSIKKRMREAAEESGYASTSVEVVSPEGSKSKRRKKDEEKRLRRFRTAPPVAYIERLGRCRTQRMFLIDRERRLSEDGTHEEEAFDLAGSTGNIYQITISKVPRCTCPDNSKGNQCKHIVYILVNVLKAREELAYQLAFLTTELNEIFQDAPLTPQSQAYDSSLQSTPDNRKPIEGDCPICMMEFENTEDIVWCKSTCGNNIHRNCFDQWAASKAGQVKCVYCRMPWKGDSGDAKKIQKTGKKNAEGYVNVATQLGISSERDYSSYHQPWAWEQGYYD